MAVLGACRTCHIVTPPLTSGISGFRFGGFRTCHAGSDLLGMRDKQAAAGQCGTLLHEGPESSNSGLQSRLPCDCVRRVQDVSLGGKLERGTNNRRPVSAANLTFLREGPESTRCCPSCAREADGHAILYGHRNGHSRHTQAQCRRGS